jgi:hypothetical protein
MWDKIKAWLAGPQEQAEVYVLRTNSATFFYDEDEIKAHHEQVWAELDPEIRHRAVSLIRRRVPVGQLRELRDIIDRHGDDWPFTDLAPVQPHERLHIPIPYHFAGGMAMRNCLREEIGDDELPTGTWDDYYIQAVEAAVGKRDA